MENLTVKELLDLFKKYNRRRGTSMAGICLYDDGSGFILSELWPHRDVSAMSVCIDPNQEDYILTVLGGGK